MIAKNVGIRRARGAFVLCTNVDLLFSDALVSPAAGHAAARRHLLSGQSLRRARRDRSPVGHFPAARVVPGARHSSARLGRPIPEHQPRAGWPADTRAQSRSGCSTRWRIGMRIFWSREKRRFYQLDSFACGDFTLMSREMWTCDPGVYRAGSLFAPCRHARVDRCGRARLQAARVCARRVHVSRRSPVGLGDVVAASEGKVSGGAAGHRLQPRARRGLYAMEQGKLLGLNRDDWGYAGEALEE